MKQNFKAAQNTKTQRSHFRLFAVAGEVSSLRIHHSQVNEIA